MIASTLLDIPFVPVFFVLMQRIGKSEKGKENRE
jgi:hypothetical protein